MKTLAKLLAVVCILILIIAIPLSLFAFDLGRTVFNAPLVKRIGTDEVVSSKLIPIVIEWFIKQQAQIRINSGQAAVVTDEPDALLLLSYIDQDGWQRIKEEIISADIITGWVHTMVDGLYGWIDSPDRTPQLTLDLEPLITRIDSDHGINAIMVAYGYLKPCTQEEIDDFLKRVAEEPTSGDVVYNLCQFPDPWYEDQLSDYVNSLDFIVTNFPKSISLTDRLAQTLDTRSINPEVIKQQLRTARTATRFAWAPSLVLLLILLLLSQAWSLGVRAGFPLFVGGGLALLPPLLYQGLITRLLTWVPLNEVPPVIMTEATRSLIRFIAEVFKPMLIQAIFILVVGLLIMLISMLFGKKRKKLQTSVEGDSPEIPDVPKVPEMKDTSV